MKSYLSFFAQPLKIIDKIITENKINFVFTLIIWWILNRTIISSDAESIEVVINIDMNLHGANLAFYILRGYLPCAFYRHTLASRGGKLLLEGIEKDIKIDDVGLKICKLIAPLCCKEELVDPGNEYDQRYRLEIKNSVSGFVDVIIETN